jgi:hypothetical protein
VVGLVPFGRTIFCVAVLTIMSGCRDWRHHQGYKIVADHGDRHAVVYGSDIIVGPKITHWGIFRDYLLVYKEAHDSDMKWSDQAGYIIIDTSDGTTTFSATKKEYQSILVKQLGVPAYETELQSIFPFGSNPTPKPNPVGTDKNSESLK